MQKFFGGNAIGNVANQKSTTLPRPDDSGHCVSPLYCTYFKSSGCCCRLPEMKWSVTNHFKTIKIMSIARLNSLAAAARPFLDGIKIIILGLRDKIYVHWSRYKYKSRGGASQEKCWDGFSIFDRYISTYFVLLCAYRIL